MNPLWRCAAAVLLVGCGGEIEDEPMVGRAPFPPAPPDAVPYDEALLGRALEVPGGTAVIGGWRLREVAPHFVAAGCAFPQASFFSLNVKVGSFRLMELEVTNRAYAACVDAGACQPPSEFDPDPSAPPLGDWRDRSHADEPVTVDYHRARAFCRHNGGDLPTRGEWARAAGGDDPGYAIHRLSEAYFDCARGSSAAICAEILDANVITGGARPRRPTDPRLAAWDRGPYGHLGLFAGAAEWVKSTYASDVEAGCAAIHDDATLYRDLEPGDISTRVATELPIAVLDSNAFALIRDHAIGEFDVFEDARFIAAGTATYYTGFRCALPETGSP